MARIVEFDSEGNPYYKTIDEDKPLTRKEKAAAGLRRKDEQSRDLRAEQLGRLSGRTALMGINPALGVLDYATGGKASDIAQRVGSGATFGLDKRLRAGISAIGDKIKGERLGDAYDRNLIAERRAEVALKDRTGLAGDVAEFGGALVTPVKGAGLAIKGARALRRGKDLGRLGQYVIGGMGAGATSGALEGAARSEDLTDIPQVAGNTLKAAGIGALTGGALGAAAIPIGGAVRSAVRAVRPGGRFAAGREAVEAGEHALINQIERGGSVSKAEQRIGELSDQSAEPRLADVSAQTQSALRALTDKGVKGTDEAQAIFKERGVRRGGRLRSVIERVSGVDSAVTSAARQRTMEAVRKAEGGTDYALGGALDQPMLLTPQQQKLLKSQLQPGTPADRTFVKMFNKAVDTVKANPNALPSKPGEPATARVLDETLRGYRQKISRLYKAGKGNEATALRGQFDALRGALREQNPQYADIIDNQARRLATERAAKLGDKWGGKIFENPREVMDEITRLRRSAHADDIEAFRGSLADRAFTLTGSRASMPAKIQKAISDPLQPEGKALWDFILGGEAKTAEAMKWLKAEEITAATERKLGGSQTSTNLEGLEGLDENTVNAMMNLGRAGVGAATGSPGMLANALALTGKYTGRAIAGKNIEASRKIQLKNLMRRVERGKLTRMQLRAKQKEAIRAARRQQGTNVLGRAAGYPAAVFNTEDEEY